MITYKDWKKPLEACWTVALDHFTKLQESQAPLVQNVK